VKIVADHVEHIARVAGKKQSVLLSFNLPSESGSSYVTCLVVSVLVPTMMELAARRRTWRMSPNTQI